MSGLIRPCQNKYEGMRGTGRMLSPYPPTMEARPNLFDHCHRPAPPDIAKKLRLTVVRICPHQSCAASSSATTWSRPVMTESATKDTGAGHTMTLRVRQATVTGVRRRRRVTTKRLTHRHPRLCRGQAVTMAEEARVIDAAHPLLTRGRRIWSRMMYVCGSIRSTRPGKDHTWDHVALDLQYGPQLTPKVSGLTRPSSPMTAPLNQLHGC